MIWSLIITLSLLLLNLGLLTAIMLYCAHLGWYFVKIKQESIVFINKGESMKAIWPNVKGHMLSKEEDFEGRRWLVRAKSREESENRFFEDSSKITSWFEKKIWNKFGIRFIGIFWPYEDVYKIKTDQGLGKEEAEHLHFLNYRPLSVKGVEFGGDTSKIDLQLRLIFQIVIPEIPVYQYQGKYFELLDGVIKAAIVDFFGTHQVAVHRETGEFAHDTYNPESGLYGMSPSQYKEKYSPSPLTFEYWLKIKKTSDSPMKKLLRSLNVTKEYYETVNNCEGKEDLAELVKKLTDGFDGDIYVGKEKFEKIVDGDGLIPKFGFALVDFRVLGWEVDSNTVELSETLMRKEIEIHKAESARREAFGLRDAITLKAMGESRRIELIFQSLIQQGESHESAARMMDTLMKMENIKESQITTYVEGGEKKHSVIVGTQPSSKKNNENK
ncbi:MAG: hypothetical protein ACQESA_03155 [Patescibacteria group bacterium]